MERVRMMAIGGLGEVGRNMLVVAYGDARVVVDCGIGFPRPDERDGVVEQYLPDVTAVGGPIDAVVLTHGHDDHIAALSHLVASGLPIRRVVGFPFSVELARAKLADGLPQPPFLTVRPGQTVPAGPFSIELVRVAHSIPDAAALILGTPIGRVVVSGDYKLETTAANHRRRADVERLAEIGRAGVVALVADSTNATEPGRTPSEDTTAGPLRELVRAQPGRVVVTAFASNIDRVGHAFRAAEAAGRSVTLLGRSMLRNTGIAIDLGELDPPERGTVPPRALDTLAPRRSLLVTTGSQGEESAVLARAARGEHPALRIGHGDSVIFASRPVPGNEATVETLQLALQSRGARVLTRADARIHVSGHARSDEIAELLSLIRPRFLVPAHGERHMLDAQAAIAERSGLAAEQIIHAGNGDVIEIDAESARIVDHVPVRRVAADGDGRPLAVA